MHGEIYVELLVVLSRFVKKAEVFRIVINFGEVGWAKSEARAGAGNTIEEGTSPITFTHTNYKPIMK